jgi:hypothetical protein
MIFFSKNAIKVEQNQCVISSIRNQGVRSISEIKGSDQFDLVDFVSIDKKLVIEVR